MNIKKYYKSLLAAAMMVAGVSSLTGCSEDLDYPTVEYPSSDLVANVTILDLKKAYWQSTDNYCTLVEQNSDGEDIIIRGRVIANDITGNIYQQLIIQDETAAITISVAKNDIYKTFPLGEEVFVNVTGLYVGAYANLFQIGAAGTRDDGTPTTAKMNEGVFDAHVECNGAPQPELINTFTLAIPEILRMNNSADDMQKYQSQLIEIKDVSFVDGGVDTWAVQGSNGDNRYLTDINGNQLLVRNSGKSSFNTEKLPAGIGTVVGILQMFTTNWQFVFRTNEDCFGFTGSAGPGAVVDNLDETFDSGIPSIWTSLAVSGTAKWFYRNYNNNGSAEVTAYNKTAGANGFESWLISPAVDLDKVSEKTLSFSSMVGYSGNGELEVYVLTDADPAQGTATKLDVTNIPQPNNTWSDWVQSSVSLAEFSGEVHIGFVYKAAAGSNYTTYRVDNVVVGTHADVPDVPDTPSDNPKFRLATTITSGNSYVLVVDGNVGTAVDEKYSYGRLAMSEVAITDGELTTDAKNAIVITEVAGGYTMVDSYGRYMSMDASDSKHLTNFQLYSQQQEGSEWNISVDSDGIVTITNVYYPDVNVVRSGTYMNIAPSDIVKFPTFTRPVLYEMVK